MAVPVKEGRSHPAGSDRSRLVEGHSIDPIPDSERRGRPWHQFNVWFAVNMNPIPIVIGATAATSGLSWQTAVWVDVVGTVLGAVGMALATSMGPRMGMPQMAISRSAFGHHGNHLPTALATLLFVGYFSTTLILGAQTVQQFWDAPYALIAVVVGVVSIALTVFGYDLVHWLERWLTLVTIAAFATLTAFALTGHHHTVHFAPVHGSAQTKAALLLFGAVFSYAVGWSVYAADYSRYLPRRTPLSRTFAFSGLGLTASVLWMQFLGYAVGRLSYHGGITDGIRALAPSMATPIYVVILLVSVAGCVMNAYSGAMSAISCKVPLRRTPATVLVGAVGIVLSVAFGGPSFEPTLEKFLFLVVYFVTPWLAIVVLDFFVAHRAGRDYPPASAFQVVGPPFGRVRWDGMLAFLIGVGVSVPFMATDLYTGPVGRALGGADLSYLVSACVAALVYLGARRLRPRPAAA